MISALELLSEGAEHLRVFLQPSGELHDPVFGEPTQYGTAYFAYVNAAMGRLCHGAAAESSFEMAERGLEATLRHLLDRDAPPATSSYAPPIASSEARNHRDFTWLPVLRVLRLLRAAGRPGLDGIAEQVRRVAVPGMFAARSPNNWAAVWLAGEWLRISDGLSPNPREMVDAWLAPFFEGPDARVDLEMGFYYEPGFPNSYDLFTRYHLLELLVDGYSGHYRRHLDQLLERGLRRSLAVQLSNGSLASAHRSTGQLWTLTAQCVYFHMAASLCPDRVLAARAREGAALSFRAAAACRRSDEGVSPVENTLPANFRVGYEQYTADAHYVSLALAFLARAVLAGFTGAEHCASYAYSLKAPEQTKPNTQNLDAPARARNEADDPTALGGPEPGAEGVTASLRPGAVAEDVSAPVRPEREAHVEAEPLWRSLLHGDGWSVHVNLAPRPGYDAFGIADVSAGPDYFFRFGGQVHHVASGSALTLGLAVRSGAGELRPLADARTVEGRFAYFDPVTRCLEAGAGADGLPYRLQVSIHGDALCVVEDAGELECSLIVPYLRDRGDGACPSVEPGPSGLRLSRRGDNLEVVTERPVVRAVHLPHGFESRHGLVGVVRLDLAGSGPVVYRLRRGK